MANIVEETTGLSDTSGKERTGDLGLLEQAGEQAASKLSNGLTSVTPSEVDGSGTVQKPAPVDFFATRSPSAASASTSSPSLPAPHPKKFSAVNINKKFLEKNSSASGSSHPTSSSTSLKSGASAPRPAIQTTAAHSRLVTTKLTATPLPSSTTGPGWSRPSSAASPVASSPSSTPNTTSHNPVALPAAPQLPHVGKVIQPQPRVAALSSNGLSKKDVSGPIIKPVWGNVKPAVGAALKLQNDFPTAAEVAQVRNVQIHDAKEASEAAAASRQARSEEADTFRGVHLDPNAHHWDEMEEDDDNFLDGVIEFGDGRQYKVQPSDELPQQESSREPSDHPPAPGSEPQRSQKSPEPRRPAVNKEERFADDFDRSWPRSSTSPAIPQREFAPHPIPTSPTSSHAAHSPQEASRVLFNERSNRLEPYSNAHPPLRQGPSQNQFPTFNRTGRPDLSRDAPPHAQNVQLLQKSAAPNFGGNFTSRPRTHGTGFKPVNDRPGDRESLPSLHIPSHDLGLNRARDRTLSFNSTSSVSASQEREGRGRFPSTSMGPPPVPSSVLRDRSKDSTRQIPPHLDHIPPPSQRRLSSHEPHPRPQLTSHDEISSSIGSASAHPISSPILSTSLVSPSVIATPLISGMDVEEARKATMHSAAERAKLRRQQEEEQREKEKDRARKKAAELEEKMKSQEAVKEPPEEIQVSVIEDAVMKIISDAVDIAQNSSEPVDPSSLAHLTSPSSKPTFLRTPSLKGISRQTTEQSRPSFSNRRPPHLAPASASQLPATATQADSWRSRTGSFSQPPRRESIQAQVVPPVPVPSVVLHSMDSFSLDTGDEELEVVEFSEHGRLIGIVDHPAWIDRDSSAPTSTSSRPPRPVASDFLDDDPQSTPSVPSKSVPGPWRRKVVLDRNHQDISGPNIPSSPQGEHHDVSVSTAAGAGAAPSPSDDPLPSHIVPDRIQVVSGHVPVDQNPAISPGFNAHRNPRSPNITHNEAVIASLDDAMSRIKGALHGMQCHDITKESSVELDIQLTGPGRPKLGSSVGKPELSLNELKWVPPALRQKLSGIVNQNLEIFDVTVAELPRSPKPAWGSLCVRLPKVSRPVEVLTKRQQAQVKFPPAQVRWDILSWSPPVEGMNRKDFSLNDVLFRRSQPYKGKLKYRVVLPNNRRADAKSSAWSVSSGPKVNLPSSPATTKTNGGGSFGKAIGASDSTSWRKSGLTPSKPLAADAPTDFGLNTVSRSPPPEVASVPAEAPISAEASSTPITSAKDLSRSRSQPKMPVGSAVAFYRDSRVDTVDGSAKTSVNFIVTSELDDGHPRTITSSVSPKHSVSLPTPVLATQPAASHVETKSRLDSPEFIPSLLQSKPESKTSDDSTDRTPITPPTHSASIAWTKPTSTFPIKESPARGPDPEHLKAVWSQASDKTGLHAINSLEGIADDLTALPFTLQDVKSEDGETPPPTAPSGPSRMSSYDVTRAFQQVPPSSSSNNTRVAPLSPSSPVASVIRPHGFSYSVPPNAAMRPSYPTYPSPMMSHSPAPAMMYPMAPSPVPTRMPVNGHSPLYSQPLWMPLPGPPGQNHAGMMRSVGSPYPAQLVPYPSPGGGPIYPPQPVNMQNQPAQHNGGSQARGMSSMSPAVPHAAPAVPMYAGSPVLIHAPVMQLPPNHGYMPMPSDRQPRSDGTPGHPMQPGNHHPPTHATEYTAVPPTPFARSNW